MLDKLEAIYARYQEIEQQMNDPQVTSDMKRYVKLSKDYKDLQPVVKAYHDYKTLLDTIAECKELLSTEKDEELREMAKTELAECSERRDKMEEEIRILLIPEDPTDSKNAVVEIRGGTGGDEACIFAGDLFRMYTRFCEKKHWKIEVVDFNEGPSGGYKDITFNVTGEKVYGMLKYESGVHRVQRVPATETQGRVHTSAAGVVVLPEAEELDVELNMSDVKKETFCASGPGGQCVNTTYSAVRLTHIPTGIVVSMQDQKSQIKNMEKAISILRTRLYEREYNKYMEELSSKRKTMVATGDRSEKAVAGRRRGRRHGEVGRERCRPLPGGGRRVRRRGDGGQFRADHHHPVLLPLDAGGQRLHGARRVRDRQAAAPPGSVRA